MGSEMCIRDSFGTSRFHCHQTKTHFTLPVGALVLRLLLPAAAQHVFLTAFLGTTCQQNQDRMLCRRTTKLCAPLATAHSNKPPKIYMGARALTLRASSSGGWPRFYWHGLRHSAVCCVLHSSLPFTFIPPHRSAAQ